MATMINRSTAAMVWDAGCTRRSESSERPHVSLELQTAKNDMTEKILFCTMKALADQMSTMSLILASIFSPFKVCDNNVFIDLHINFSFVRHGHEENHSSRWKSWWSLPNSFHSCVLIIPSSGFFQRQGRRNSGVNILVVRIRPIK